MESEDHIELQNLKAARVSIMNESNDRGLAVHQVLSLYGEAMVRVGQLEGRLKDLELVAQARNAQQEELTRSQQRIEQLEGRIKELELGGQAWGLCRGADQVSAEDKAARRPYQRAGCHGGQAWGLCRGADRASAEELVKSQQTVQRLESRVQELIVESEENKGARQDELLKAQQKAQRLETRVQELRVESETHKARQRELIRARQSVEKLEGRVQELEEKLKGDEDEEETEKQRRPARARTSRVPVASRGQSNDLEEKEQEIAELNRRVSSLLTEQEIMNQRLVGDVTTVKRRRTNRRGWRRLLGGVQKRRSG